MAVVWYAALSSLTQKLSQVGENLVNIEFPPPSISPVYLKPITYLYIGALLFMYSELELNKDRIRNLPSSVKTLAKFFAFIVAGIFFYELLYNFALWGGDIAAGAILGKLNPDLYANPFPHLTEPWNLVFVTKLWSVFFIAGLYVFWFFNRLEDPITTRNAPTNL